MNSTSDANASGRVARFEVSDTGATGKDAGMGMESAAPSSAFASAERSVLVVDNDASYRGALVEAIGATDDLAVIATAASVEDGIALAVALRPALVVVDVRMPDGGGARVAREVSRRLPQAAILAISVHTDGERRREMIEAGADAFLVKGGAVEELLTTVRALLG
jgi:DNA-binding NarL/FixJ family response regulator